MLQCNPIEHIQSIRAALYARVSSENQQQAGTIQSQIEAVVHRVHQDGLTIEAEFRFIDDGHSGATPEVRAAIRMIAVHAPRIPAPAPRTTGQSRAYGAQVEIGGSGQ